MASYLRPDSLDGALAALAERPRCVLAGGTDHFPARATWTPDEDILDITGLPGLRRVRWHDDHIRVPCLATWTDLLESGLPARCAALVQAARQVGGWQVQNAGTLVGNLCNASPAADGAPCLLALDASIELASLGGTRILSVAAFLRGPRQTLRRSDELAVAILIPRDDAARSCFLKLGARRYLVISIAMVAACVSLDRAGRVTRAGIAVGACAATARRLPAVEAALLGQVPRAALAQPAHLAGLAPIDDIRATAEYRSQAALELVRRSLDELGATPAEAAA